jgi:mRNA-degrading endonuclease RelE of RelBE toxin-antitoxin system
MVVFQFTKQAFKEFESLDASIRNMLTESLVSLKDEERLRTSSKRVIELLPATHRLRIGSYRFLYKIE